MNYAKAKDAHQRGDLLIECLQGLIGDMVDVEEGPEADEIEMNRTADLINSIVDATMTTGLADYYDICARCLESHEHSTFKPARYDVVLTDAGHNPSSLADTIAAVTNVSREHAIDLVTREHTRKIVATNLLERDATQVKCSILRRGIHDPTVTLEIVQMIEVRS